MGVRLGEDDEIELTGPNVFLGYYKQPELTGLHKRYAHALHNRNRHEIRHNRYRKCFL